MNNLNHDKARLAAQKRIRKAEKFGASAYAKANRNGGLLRKRR